MNKNIFAKHLLHLCLSFFLFPCPNALTWNQLMETAISGTNEISDMLEPYIVENFPTANVSKQCISSLIMYAEGIKKFEPWAVKMFDGTGKPPSSVLSGTYLDFGLFDECLFLEVDADAHQDFRGQFCILSLRSPLFPPTKLRKKNLESYIETHEYPPEWAKETTNFLEHDWSQFFGLYLGICIPSTCSERDLIHIITAYAKPAELEASLSDCQVNEPRKWKTIEKVGIFATTCLIAIIIIGTILDLIERRKMRNNVSCHKEVNKHKTLKVFSVISNLEILLKKRVTDHSLDFLNGMKFYIVIWLLILHLFAIETSWEFKRHRNLNHFIRLSKPYTIMFENSLTISSYFIFLNGFLSTYSLKIKQVQTSQKNNKKKNSLLKLILIKYLRLAPSVSFLMLMTFVIPLTYNGPIWNSTWDDVHTKCLKNGWTNLLFVANTLEYNSHCWIHMWLYSTLIQFQILCLPLLHIAKRRPRLALLIGILVVLGCGVRDMVVSIQYEFGFPTIPALKSLIYFKDFTSKIYCKPFNHFSTYAVGMLFGWINLKAFKINKFFLTVGWGFYVLLSLGLFYVVNLPTENLTLIAVHNSFRGLFFGLQMGWLVYTCLNGTAGVLGKIFAWKALIPFGKLLNSVVMYHPLLIVTYEAMRRERFYTSILHYVQDHLSLIVCSFLFSVITFLLVESPFNRLCDMWEGKSSTSPRKNINNCLQNGNAMQQPKSNGILPEFEERENVIKETVAKKEY